MKGKRGARDYCGGRQKFTRNSQVTGFRGPVPGDTIRGASLGPGYGPGSGGTLGCSVHLAGQELVKRAGRRRLKLETRRCCSFKVYCWNEILRANSLLIYFLPPLPKYYFYTLRSPREKHFNAIIKDMVKDTTISSKDTLFKFDSLSIDI